LGVPAQDHILHTGFLERVLAETDIAFPEDDQLGALQEGAVVRAERRIDHATVGESNRVHRHLENPVELRTIPIGGTDVGRAEWCVASQSIEGSLEQQSVLPLPEQQLTVRQQIERLELWRRLSHAHGQTPARSSSCTRPPWQYPRDSGGRLFGGLGIQVEHANPTALVGEVLAHRGPQSRRAAGHNRDAIHRSVFAMERLTEPE